MKSDRDFLTFLKGMLKGKRAVIFILIAIAVILAVVFSKVGADDESLGENETEKRIAELCSSVDGVGDCRVMVIFEKNDDDTEEGRVYSVAVICEGADNVTVRAKITELITSLYGIGSNRVSVAKLEK